jgi:hypothetical protein
MKLMADFLMVRLREIWRLRDEALAAMMAYLKSGDPRKLEKYRYLRQRWIDAENANAEANKAP